MDIYEVTAVGNLYKKNFHGTRKWNLREFALTGVHLLYYKDRVIRGEYDISGCTIRCISAEEAKQPSAKYVSSLLLYGLYYSTFKI
jgi:hypothetical protein